MNLEHKLKKYNFDIWESSYAYTLAEHVTTGRIDEKLVELLVIEANGAIQNASSPRIIFIIITLALDQGAQPSVFFA